MIKNEGTMKKVCSEVLETTTLISLIFPRNIFPTYYKNDKYRVNRTKKKKKSESTRTQTFGNQHETNKRLR